MDMALLSQWLTHLVAKMSGSSSENSYDNYSLQEFPFANKIAGLSPCFSEVVEPSEEDQPLTKQHTLTSQAANSEPTRP
jgi:hypothetical protein